ncbi:MAG: helix-hairpin-helix domain-containing protein [Bryobacteraceae bacterium]|nr:helix-hairpin-helix domain-containing protein [Bryobacteraceae bacterium]
MADARALRDLEGIGGAMLGDFAVLGVATVSQLAAADPDELYARLSQLTGRRQDICVLDVFRCAVAQARDPRLPDAQRKWWWWSRQRRASGMTQAARQ